MKQVELKASDRTQLGGNTAKRYRKEGKIPAVIYGESGEKHLVIEQGELDATLKTVLGKAALINMSFDDGTESRYAVVKEVERHPVTDKVMHVDFFEIVRGKPMMAMIPLHMHGESYGVKNEGGIVEMHQYELKVKCRPRDLPETITIDIKDLRVGGFIYVKDLAFPEGVTAEEAADKMLVSCSASKVGGAADASSGAADEGAAEEKK